MSPIARLRSVAMMRGFGPVRTLDASSRNVTSRTQWTLFSIVQWPRTYPAMRAGDASRASRLVTMKTAIADFSCLRTQRFPFLTRTVRVTYLSISATWRACGNRFAMCAGASVAFLLRRVLHGDGGPVQGVELVPQRRGIQLDSERVVRQELLADDPGVGLHGVAGRSEERRVGK